MEKFEKELEILLNKHSMENGSDTPDFILAEYLKNCIDNFNKTLKKRENWYGRTENPNINIDKNLYICNYEPNSNQCCNINLP